MGNRPTSTREFKARADLLDSRSARASLRGNPCAGRAFLRWAFSCLELPCDWLHSWVLRKPTRRPARLPPSNPVGFRNQAMLAIICEHGIYANGLAALDLADLDLTRYQLLGRTMSAELTEKLQRYLQKGHRRCYPVRKSRPCFCPASAPACNRSPLPKW